MRTSSPVSGFTLVELLLSVGLAGVILLLSSLLLATLLQARVKNQTLAEVEEQGLAVMQVMTQAIRNAETLNSPTLGISATTLSLNTPMVGNNPTVFSSALGSIQIKEGSATAVALNNSRVTVSSLSFQNLAQAGTPGSLRIQFTLTAVNPSGRNEYSFTKIFTGSASLRQP